MKIVIIEANQSLRDIAITHYGTLEAIGELITINNGALKNDRTALAKLGIDYFDDNDFYIDVALEPATQIKIDTQSLLCKSDITRDLKTIKQTKYNGTDY